MAPISKKAAELMEEQLLHPVLWFFRLSMYLDDSLIKDYHEYQLPITELYDDWLATVYLLLLEEYNSNPEPIENIRITKGTARYVPIPKEFLSK